LVQEGRESERYAKLTGIVQGWDGLASWRYSKRITIQASKVDTDLTGYPLLINLATDSDLATHAKTDGSDIIFVDEYGTKLPREIEKYTTATGLLVAHVKCNVLNNSNVNIYMLFGNASATETNSTDTWDSDFNAVWHMDDNPNTSTIQDSTANNLDGTKKGAAEPVEATGQIYKAQSADGSNDKITLGTSALLSPSDLTAEFWVYRDDDWSVTPFSKCFFFAKTDGVWNSKGWYVVVENTNSHRIQIITDDGTWFSLKNTGVALNDLFPLYTWTKLTIGWNSTDDTCYIYINDTSKTIGEKTGTSITDVGGIKYLMHNGPTYNGFYKGGLDEIKISKIKRPAGYVTTMYHNEASPSTFYSLSALAENYLSYRGARIRGGVSDSRNATILGKITTGSSINTSLIGTIPADTDSEILATIHGYATDLDVRDSVITGKDLAISELESTLLGKAIGDSQRNSTITGKTTGNSEIETVITGKLSDNSEVEALIQGKITTESEINASITGKALTNERLAVISGKDSSNNIRDASIQGKLTTLDSRESTIIGKASDYSNINAKLTGSTSDFSEINAVIHGIDTIDNEINVVITGKTTDNSEIDATIHGGLIVSSEITAKVITGYPAEGEIDVVITGSLPSNDERNAKTYGKDLAVNERDSTIHGIDTISSSISAKITGGKIANIRDASITGKDFGSDSIEATIRGKLPNSSEISASLIGGIIETDTRSAVITGMYFGSERSALIVGAKCPYYTGDKHTWNERNKVNWYTDDIHPFQTKSEVDWFVKNKKTITRKIRKVSCS
jgi:hypothetical protein